MKNVITEILGHDILWNLADTKEFAEVSIERIESLIKDGYTSGELIEDENAGGWHIINWRDIAIELYNNCPAQTEKQIAARARFDKEWTF